MAIKPSDFSHETGKHGHFTIPLKDVISWLRDGDEIPLSQFEAKHRDHLFQQSHDESSGYEVDSEKESEDIENQEVSLPRLVEEEADRGYEGDNDNDTTSDTISVGTVDSLILAAERLPHLVRHPLLFKHQRPKTSSPSDTPSKVPRRKGARISCVLRHKNFRAQQDTTTQGLVKCASERAAESNDNKHLAETVGLSFRLLRSQDSLLLTKERLEHEHEVPFDDDDSDDYSFFNEQVTSVLPEPTSPAHWSGKHFPLESPRGIVTDTRTYKDVFAQKRSSRESKELSAEDLLTKLATPSLVIHKE